MPTYVAFLRGVNLGPQRKVSMPRLAELARELGHADVWTWVSSGNLVLGTDREADDVGRELEDALEREHGVRVDVAVRSAAELSALLRRNPFPDGSPSQVTVTFLMGPAPADLAQRLAGVATAAEPYVVEEREVWVHYTDGQARSVLAAGFSRVAGVSTTTRTLGTLSRIVAKIQAAAGA